MSTSPILARAQSLELDGWRLKIPSIQGDPFPLRAISPSPCTEACPAGINVKSYVSLIAEDRFAEALEVVRERCPLPGICGRICHHPCEAACRRATTGGPIAIRALKRFVADLELELPPPAPLPTPDKRERVAIIGSGPAGVTAAYDLARAGYPVTVFEAEAKLGGMLRYGIADYRLPTEILDYEIGVLERAGMDFRTNHRIGVDGGLEELLSDGGYSAVLLAVGAQRGRSLGIDGEEECTEVEDALAFLRRVNSGERKPIAGRVVVIGGGSTAIEAARSALRLGAQAVEIVYRRQRAEMPADEEEIDTAAAEGISFRFLSAPSRAVVKNGKLEALECLEVELGEPDASGRRRPLPRAGSEFLISADRVFAAVGQEARFDFLPDDFVERVAARGRLEIDPVNWMTALHGVFAAGDVVTGPATVIDAIAAGHEVAEAMRAFLEGEQLSEAVPDSERHAARPTTTEYEIPQPEPGEVPRRHPALAEIARGHEFDEVESAFSALEAIAEARRCLRCGPCSECRICASSCDRRHITFHTEGTGADARSSLLRAPARLALALETEGAMTAWLEDDLSGASVALLPTRVAIDEQHCRGCAKCIEVCAFDALSLVDPDAPETTVCLEPALCRGCNLCVAVCPTDAAVPTAIAPEWWGSDFTDLYPSLVGAPTAQRRTVVFACQRRAGAIAMSLAELELEVELLPVRCSGQIEAGMLLDTYRHGAEAILVAGCLNDNCRYGAGGRLAATQVERAHSLLHNLGGDPGRVVADWSAEPDNPLLDMQMLRFVTEPFAAEFRSSSRSVSEGRKA